MPRDNRLSRMLHVLIHMEQHEARMTSDAIAAMLGTNAVVVRRMMAGLREQGIVTSEKGHGGGWRLGRGLSFITLRDVYQAVGAPVLFNIGPQAESPQCLVEQAVDAQLAQTLAEAEQAVLTRFGEITLADLASDYLSRFEALKLNAPESGHHSSCGHHAN